MCTTALAANIEESAPEVRADPPAITTTTLWVNDPVPTIPISADQHDSEVSLPPVPDLPEGITLESTTTTTIVGIDNARCPEMWSLAVDVGWPVEWLPTLDAIAMAESACDWTAISRTYDYGLLQINWAAHGERLEAKGLTRDDLLVPVTNLTEALWIAQYADEHYTCWAQPWYMSGDRC